MIKNAYIHIPFCVQKCNYCAFVSYNRLQRKKTYIRALINEIQSNYKGEELKTLYFGGGTPSLLTIDEVRDIISCFNITIDTEVTFEVNPNKLKLDYLIGLKQLGINRLSIGAQTFESDILKFIGRLHTTNDITDAVKNARFAGFENISLDLIYGLPSQTLKSLEDSLNKAIQLNVDHISLYGLKIEEGTPFSIMSFDNLPDDDMQADMYLLASDVLKNAGFEKYEISNFSKNRLYSHHNLNYWDANTYYGFGCGAHGYENDYRYENEIDLEKYIENPLLKKVKTQLTQQEKIEESIFLGFRKASGIDAVQLEQKYNYNFEKNNKAAIEKFISSGYLVKTDRGYSFSDEGFLLSNEILCGFLT